MKPLRLPDLLLAITILLVLLSGFQMLSIDSDLGRHLALGEYMLAHRSVPTVDLLSHTLTGESRPPYEWLSQIMFALANRWLGLDGVILLTAVLIGFAIFLMFRNSFQRSQSALISLFVTILVLAASSLHWLPRPHIITFIFLAIWLDRLEKIRTQKQIHWVVFPVLMLAWANLHGGFIFGFLALAAYFGGWVWDTWRGNANRALGLQLILIGASSFIASVLTPGLWGNWLAVLNNRSAFILNRTVETMPPSFDSASTIPFLILLIAAVIFAMLNHKNLSASHIFLLGGLGLMSLLMARNIPLFAIACAPILSMWIADSIASSSSLSRFDARFISLAPARIPLLSSLLLLSATFFFANRLSTQPMYQFNPQVFPVQATDWLIANPHEGNMFNDFNWGGYLLYRLWDHDLVFVDSQSDFYGEPLMREYETILLAQNNWETLLENHQVNWVIIPPTTPLAQKLTTSPTWEVVYQDSVAIIIQRTR